MLDIAVSYEIYKFLGHDFLTWLWFMIDKDPGLLKTITGEEGYLEIGNRMVFENRSGNNVMESVTIKGDDAGLEEGILSLKKGAMVTELNLSYRLGERIWQFTVRGESFHITQMKLPVNEKDGPEPDPEIVVLEKADLCEKIFILMDNLYAKFVKIRISERLGQETLPNMRLWLKSLHKEALISIQKKSFLIDSVGY